MGLLLSLALALATPTFNFVDPTEANASIVATGYTGINVSIDEPTLDSLTYN